MSINSPILRKIIAFVTHPWGMVVTAIPIIFIYGYFSIPHEETKTLRETTIVIDDPIVKEQSPQKEIPAVTPEEEIREREEYAKKREALIEEWKQEAAMEYATEPFFRPLSFYTSIFQNLNNEFDNWRQLYTEQGEPLPNMDGITWSLGFNPDWSIGTHTTYSEIEQRIKLINDKLKFSPEESWNMAEAEMDLYTELYAYGIGVNSMSPNPYSVKSIPGFLEQRQKIQTMIDEIQKY